LCDATRRCQACAALINLLLHGRLLALQAPGVGDMIYKNGKVWNRLHSEGTTLFKAIHLHTFIWILENFDLFLQLRYRNLILLNLVTSPFPKALTGLHTINMWQHLGGVIFRNCLLALYKLNLSRQL
jgi:hypothetical protein